jgi:hypothetical protein
MKNLYAKLVIIDKQISDAKKYLSNIEGWAVSEYEKNIDREKLNIQLDDLHEKRLTVLFDLKSIVEHEIHQYNDRANIQSA